MGEIADSGSELGLAASIDRLTAAGYTDSFKAEPQGVRAFRAGCLHPPERLRVVEVLRFEGPTNPDDEAILFALECEEHGTRGTYAVPYGPQTPAADAEALRRLRRQPAVVPAR